MIVHGHTIAETIDRQPHRIGIDTGAYATGRLTAIGLEGADIWHLETDGDAQREKCDQSAAGGFP